MQGIKRRVIHALSYEIILLMVMTPILSLMFGKDMLVTATLGVVIMLIALMWNMLFNFWFEKWEKRQGASHRLLKHRIYHAICFEGGILILTVPVIAWFLQLGIWQTIVLDIGISLCIMLYTFIFQLGFDKLFGEPA